MAPISASVSIPNSHLRRGGDDTITHGGHSPAIVQHAYFRTTSISPSLQLAQDGSVGNADFFRTEDINRYPVISQVDSNAGKPSLHQLLAEASGTITSALLAKHHLPNILLQHGPLAIRHITAYLISSLPGFSTVPPARQRRMIVGALEGRGGISGVHGEVGGISGDVIFEKVGWGRWDARQKGQPSRDRDIAVTAGNRFSKLVVPKEPTSQLVTGIAIGGTDMHISTSYQSEPGIFMQSEEEADEEMADVDGMPAGENSSTNTSEDDDITDEEDWAQMGAGMRRHQGGSSPITSDGWNSSFIRSPAVPALWNAAKQCPPVLEDSGLERAREEREAVEALLKLGSV